MLLKLIEDIKEAIPSYAPNDRYAEVFYKIYDIITDAYYEAIRTCDIQYNPSLPVKESGKRKCSLK